jgi:hypothetical protein
MPTGYRNARLLSGTTSTECSISARQHPAATLQSLADLAPDREDAAFHTLAGALRLTQSIERQRAELVRVGDEVDLDDMLTD